MITGRISGAGLAATSGSGCGRGGGGGRPPGCGSGRPGPPPGRPDSGRRGWRPARRRGARAARPVATRARQAAARPDRCRRRHEVVGPMPARLVDNQHGAMGGVKALVAGEGGQGQREGRRGDRRQQAPPALPGAGPDKAIDVEPFVAALDRGDRPLAPWRPDAAQHRQQAEARLILGPERDLGRRMGLRYGGNSGGKPPFLKASWAAGSARVARGRGRCGVKPSRRIHSQPRCSLTGRPKGGTHPCRHLAAGPQVAVRGRAGQRVLQGRPPRGIQQRCSAGIGVAAVADARRSVLAGAAGHFATRNSPSNPSRGRPRPWACRCSATTPSATDCAPPDPARADTVARAPPGPGAGE